MSWDEKAAKVAQWVEHDPDVIFDLVYEDGYVDGGIALAAWQRRQLLSDEVVERAAWGIHASHDRGDWEREPAEVLDEYLNMARAALMAALEGDDDE